MSEAGAAPADTTRARLIAGDPLRALAALGVFGLHAVGAAVTESGYLAQATADPREHYAALFGLLGQAFNGLEAFVALFFVLSAYLLSRPFLRSYVDDEPLPSIPGYLVNRALRILPAFWLVLAGVVVIFGTHGDTWRNIAGLATFTRSFKASGLHDIFSQPWSLNVEVRFYLLLPLAALVLVGLKRLLGSRLPREARVVLVLGLALAGLNASWSYAQHDGPYYDSFLANACFFAPGLGLAALEFVLPRWVLGRRWVVPVAPALFVAGLAIVLFSARLTYELPTSLIRYITTTGTGLMVAGPLLWQWSGRGAWRALDNAPLRWAGERSYPLFLVHTLVLAKVAPLLATSGYKVTLAVVGLVGLAGSLVVSELVHRAVELPAMRLRRRWVRARAERMPAPIPEPTTAGELAGLGASGAPDPQ
jgi:peptidoglycan/LPS O-acetylase OafA/YrhL